MNPIQIKYKSSISQSGIYSASMVLYVFFSALLLASPCYAGAYIFAGEDFGVDIVTHPTGYSGVGGELTIGVCIDPNSANANDMQISLQNIVDTFNNQTVTTDNLKLGANNNIPDGNSPSFVDFESVVLHEVGHCIGLAHVNASSESLLDFADMDYTKATDGADNAFNIAPGPDGIIGSSDDIRGDDVNLHWFNIGINNPFQIVAPVDSSTYARDLAGNLPVADSFVANADRTVSALFGAPNTEAVMQQGTGADEAQRTLVADDVAVLRYAMSGLDEVAGNADDYTINLEYRGITTTGCDLTIGFNDDPADFSLAFCAPSGLSIGGSNHVRIVDATILVGDKFNWFFNNVRNDAADITPDAFTLTDQTNVTLNATITSANITVSGLDSSTAISVTNGLYNINGGAFTADTGVVNNGNTVSVRHTSSVNLFTATDTTLDINGVRDIFTSTTAAVPDTTPDAFSFFREINVVSGTIITSNTIVVSGITVAAPITVAGGEYSINNGSFVSVNGTVNNGDLIVVRHTASANFSTETGTTLTIGGIVGQFTSTTQAASGSDSGGGMLHPLIILILTLSCFIGYCRRKNR